MLTVTRWLLVAGLVLASSFVAAEEEKAAAPAGEAKGEAAAPEAGWVFPGDGYPMDYCALDYNVIGHAWNRVSVTHEGSELRFCGEECRAKAEKIGYGEFVTKIATNLIVVTGPSYPHKNCLACEGELGEPTTRVNYVYRNRLVQLDREECLERFKADPDKHIARQNEWVVKSQKAEYPAPYCVACAKGLDPTSADLEFFVHGWTLYVLCSDGCVETFKKSPLAHKDKLEAVRVSSRKKFLFAEPAPATAP